MSVTPSRQPALALTDNLSAIRLHALRHSFATKMLNKRVDLRYIGDLMGHADLNTTKVYTHYTNPQLRAIYDRAHGEI